MQTGLVVCDGNSLTRGSGAVPYPALLSAMLGSGWTVENLGVDGQDTLDMSADAAVQIDAQLLAPGYTGTVVVAMEIGNDITQLGTSASAAVRRFWTYCDARRANGWKVVAVTVLPRSDLAEADRRAVNSALRAGWADHADALADVAADTRMGESGDNLDTAYCGSDAVHLVTLGNAVIAANVRTAIESLL